MGVQVGASKLFILLGLLCLGCESASPPNILVRHGGKDFFSSTNVHTFDSLPLGNESEAVEFELVNLGDGRIVFDGDFYLVGPHHEDFHIVQQPDVAFLRGGASTTFKLSFLPLVGGTREASLMIETTNTATAFELPLRGEGLAGVEGDSISAGVEIYLDDVKLSPPLANVVTVPTTLLKGPSTTLSFSIHNTGAGELEINDWSWSGSHIADFEVSVPPPATVSSGEEETFEVRFEPIGVGKRQALLTIENNDPFLGNYEIGFDAEAVGGVLEVRRQADDKVILSNTGNHEFETPIVQDASDSEDFALKNIGNLALTVTDLSFPSGADHFSADGGEVTLASQENESFNVVFNPQDVGDQEGRLRISYEYSDGAATISENYSIDFKGKGALPEVLVSDVDGNPIADGSGTFIFSEALVQPDTVIATTLTIENTGIVPYDVTDIVLAGDHPGDFRALALPTEASEVGDSDTFSLEFEPSAAGLREAVVIIQSSDPGDNYSFSVNGTGVTPEIVVEEGSSTVLPSFDFGEIIDGQQSDPVVFSIENAATHPVAILFLEEIELVDDTDFEVDTGIQNLELNAGEQTTFALKFSPQSDGVKSTTVRIGNNDINANEAPNFEFEVEGRGVRPLLEMEKLVEGGPNLSLSHEASYDFGNIGEGLTEVIELQIENNGTGSLEFGEVVITGEDSELFNLVESFGPGTIEEGGAEKTFEIEFSSPTNNLGDRSAKISIPTNSFPLNGVFELDLTVTVVAPRIEVEDDVGNIMIPRWLWDGETRTAPDPQDFGTYDFGAVKVNSTDEVVFTITNSDADAFEFDSSLKIEEIQRTSADSAMFAVSNVPSAEIDAGDTDSFTVTFQPYNTGDKVVTIVIKSNDPEQPEASFQVTGTGTAPELQLLEDDTDLNHVTGEYDFGFQQIGENADPVEFTIENQGSSELTITSPVEIVGTHVGMFEVVSQPNTTIAAEPDPNSSTFEVAYVPTAEGSHQATLKIYSDDPNNNPYTITLRGESQRWVFVDQGGLSGDESATPHLLSFDGSLYGFWIESNGTVDQMRAYEYNGNDESPNWTSLDGGSLNSNALAAASDPYAIEAFNKIYLSWAEDEEVRVKVLDGSWGFVDMGGLTASGDAAEEPSLAFVDGTLYAAWAEVDAHGLIRVQEYNGNDGSPSWSAIEVGGLNKDGAQDARSPHLIAFKSELYATWVEDDPTADIAQVRVARYDGGTTWSFVDGDGALGLNVDVDEEAESPRLVVYKNNLYVIWTEAENGAKVISVAVYDNRGGSDSWPLVDNGGLNFSFDEIALAPRAAVHDDQLFVTWHEWSDSENKWQIRAKAYDGSGWSFVDSGTGSGMNADPEENAQQPHLTSINDKLYAIWREFNGSFHQIRSAFAW